MIEHRTNLDEDNDMLRCCYCRKIIGLLDDYYRDTADDETWCLDCDNSLWRDDEGTPRERP